MSPDTSSALPDGLFAPHELVRQLGTRPNPTYVVRQAGVGIGGKKVLAVAERFADVAEPGSAGEALVGEARRIATLASPNLARVREVVVRGGDLVVVGELVEGEKLQEIWRPEKLPLEIALRVVVDVLAGVGALHNLRDAKQQPMKLAHGEVSPATIVLGLDGIARVLHSVARRAPDVQPEAASVGYLAPEVASGDPYDARADVFSAGVLLWEALSGKILLTGPDADANVRRVRSGALPPATVPDTAAWAKGLVEVAAKALSAAPDARWPTAAVMAAELRKAAGLKLAPASTVAAFARSGFGERVRVRRESLESGPAATSEPAPALAGAPTPKPAAKVAPVVSAPSPRPAPVVEDLPTLRPAPTAATSAKPAPAAAPVPKPAAVTAPVAAPPQAPSSPPEASFLDVDMESAIDTVDVVPGIRAPVSEVIELESDLLHEAPASSFPPPASAAPVPSSALGGFVRDPFSGPGAFTAPPAPEVPRFGAPLAPAALAPAAPLPRPALVEELAPPSITGAPHFAAAIDQAAPVARPVAPVAPVVDPFPAPAALMTLDDDDAPPRPGTRGRKIVVLGGVAALGLVIFVLAGIRLLGRGADDGAPAMGAPPAAAAPAVAPPPTAAPEPPPPTVSAAAAIPSVVPAPPPPPPAAVTAAVTATSTPPAVVTAAPPAAAAPPPAAATAPHPTLPVARPTAVVATAPPPAVPVVTPPAAAAKPRPKPTFDPNTL
ncbi:MAG: protein kinase [Polyangiaceae bacterium]